jgi:hypothetical protein
MNLWLYQRPHNVSRSAIKNQAGLALTFLLAISNGCGGSTPPASNDNAAASSAAPPVAPLGTENDTATTQTAAAGNGGITNTAKTKHGRGEVWVDDKGQKWFGDVPMDAFFDQPYTVASNSAPSEVMRIDSRRCRYSDNRRSITGKD